MTRLVAAFPMYDRPELRPAFDELWSGPRDHLRAAGVEDVPDSLMVLENGLVAFWLRPDLLPGQTCGYPYRHVLQDHVALVGTPDFALDGCGPGLYRSAWIVSGDDPRRSLSDFDGAILACNDQGSQSGHAAPLVAAERVGLRFGVTRLSGAHVASAWMVAGDLADIARLDALSWRHIRRDDPWAAGLRVLGWTEPTPGLPFITAVAPNAPILFDSLACAIEGMPDASRSLLTLRRGVRIDPAAYLAVSDPVGDRR